MRRSTANGLIVIAALIWGFAFVAQQKGMAYMGALAFTGWRFLLGALVVLPLAFIESRQARPAINAEPAHTMLDYAHYGLIGTLLFFAAWLQQVGIGLTTVTRSGFITALYVPLVPLIGWLIFRLRPHLSFLPALILCTVGLIFITGAVDGWVGKSAQPTIGVDGSVLEPAGWNQGDLWVLASTVFWAFHVLLIDRAMHRKKAPARLACTQFVVCGLLGLIGASIFERATFHTFPANLSVVLPYLLFTGLLSVGVGFTIQVFAQQFTKASDVAILLSAEFLFAALAGMWLLNEPFGVPQAIGGGLILASIVMVQWLSANTTNAPTVPDQPSTH